MTTTITFDGILLRNVAPFTEGVGIVSSNKRLVDGRPIVQVSPRTQFITSFSCTTHIFADITLLMARIGLKRTLTITIGGTTRNFLCSITKFHHEPITPGTWRYEIEFSETV